MKASGSFVVIVAI